MPLATQIGVDILQAGGSAVDAAIAANAALGLMEPTGNGIGGDIFAIVWDAKTKKLHGLNGSGRSPLGLSYEQMKAELAKLNRETIPPHGMLPISVPGCVDGWFELHKKFGKLPMKQVLQPAINYANEGFPVSDIVAYYMETERADSRQAARRVHGDIHARTAARRRKGEVFKNPALAKTLQILAEKGRDAFYKGEIAEQMDKFFAANGGYPAQGRLRETHVDMGSSRSPMNYRGYDVYELPPNGQGIAALQILNILEGFDLKSLGYNSPQALHLMIEAKKLAFEDRAKFYADPGVLEGAGRASCSRRNTLRSAAS